MAKGGRRAKIILSKVKKKGRNHKSVVVEKVQSLVQDYTYLYTVSWQNMRVNYMNKIRDDLRSTSKFFLTKNKVLARGLQECCDEDGIHESIMQLAENLHGHRGLLFSKSPKDVIVPYFEGIAIPEYPRCGNEATQGFEIEKGPLPFFSHAIEPRLRMLGLPTCLNKGIIEMREAVTVCAEGEIINSVQSQILKLFDQKMSTFRVVVETVWSKEDNTFEVLKEVVDPPRKNTQQVVEDYSDVKFEENDEESESESDDEIDIKQTSKSGAFKRKINLKNNSRKSARVQDDASKSADVQEDASESADVQEDSHQTKTSEIKKQKKKKKRVMVSRKDKILNKRTIGGLLNKKRKCMIKWTNTIGPKKTAVNN